MVGTLPKTALLLTNWGVVEGHFTSYGDVARHLGISVSDEGQVSFMGEKVYPQYIMIEGDILNNHWKSKAEVINDWARYHMKLPKGYSLYRYLA